MHSVEFSTRRSPYMTTVPVPLARADGTETCRRSVVVLFLLLGILSISELAKAGPCLVPATLTQRFLRLTRIGEPSTEQAGDNVIVVAQGLMSRPYLTTAPVVFAYTMPDDLKPPLTRFRLCSQLRSPPCIN